MPTSRALSKALLISFLEEKCSWEELRQEVQPRTPYEIPARYRSYYYNVSVNSLQDVQMLIEEIEGSHIKIPILIKHYLKMGARLIALNIDRDFGNALDILMMTDSCGPIPIRCASISLPKAMRNTCASMGR